MNEQDTSTQPASKPTGTHWRKLVSKDSPHLTVWDIQGKTPLQVTVEKIDSQNVVSYICEAGSDMMFLHFRGGRKALGMCATNCAIMEMHHGPHIEGWAGKTVTLRAARCKGEDCIRIDVPAGAKVPRRYPKFNYTDGKEGAQ